MPYMQNELDLYNIFLKESKSKILKESHISIPMSTFHKMLDYVVFYAYAMYHKMYKDKLNDDSAIRDWESLKTRYNINDHEIESFDINDMESIIRAFTLYIDELPLDYKKRVGNIGNFNVYLFLYDAENDRSQKKDIDGYYRPGQSTIGIPLISLVRDELKRPFNLLENVSNIIKHELMHAIQYKIFYKSDEFVEYKKDKSATTHIERVNERYPQLYSFIKEFIIVYKDSLERFNKLQKEKSNKNRYGIDDYFFEKIYGYKRSDIQEKFPSISDCFKVYFGAMEPIYFGPIGEYENTEFGKFLYTINSNKTLKSLLKNNFDVWKQLIKYGYQILQDEYEELL